MAAVPSQLADLVGAPHFAHLVTVNRDGSPQSSPIWIRPDRVADDGSVESIFFVTGVGYRKALNMRREPRVAISIHDAANPYRTLEILGTASMEQRSSYDELDAISNQYLGTDYPYKGDDPSGWLVTVEVERSSTFSDIEIPEMVEPPPKGSDLLSPPHFAHIATVSSTGQPRSSVVWHRRVDGGGENDIEFWTFPTTLKVLHLRRNPAIAVSIHDEADPYRYTEVRGTATLTPDTGPQMLDELTPLYWQADRYPESEQYPIDERHGGCDRPRQRPATASASASGLRHSFRQRASRRVISQAEIEPSQHVTPQHARRRPVAVPTRHSRLRLGDPHGGGDHQIFAALVPKHQVDCPHDRAGLADADHLDPQ